MDGVVVDGVVRDGTEATAHHLEVGRTARWYALGDPGSAREVWVVLHGYRQLASRFLRRFRPVDDGTRWIVAPEALSRFYVERTVSRHGPDSRVGASWMTREDREVEIADYVAYLDALGDHLFDRVERGSARLVTLGFSQGVATAARWAVLGRWPPDRLVAWGDALPPDLDPGAAARRLRGVEVVRVLGSGDRTRRPHVEAEDVQRLDASGALRRDVRYEGGHRVEEGPLREVAALSAPRSPR